jgi:hypothetical protein
MTEPAGVPVAFISASNDTDAALAAAVRHGIEQVGRTWTRRRALRTVCTRRGTSSDRDLWTADRRAMDESQWFVLLASPGAAESDRVGREIEYWLEANSVDTLLPVLAAGTWTWDGQENDFRWDEPASVTAVAPALRGVFTEEPRHLDMSWVGEGTELTMHDPRFAEQMAELAAPMHGVTTEDLAGEDVHQRRRIQRVVRAATGVLSVMLVAAVVAALLALSAQRAADTQREAADEQAALADERTRAAVGRRIADEAISAPSLPLDLRLLLAAQAYELGVSPESEVALYELLRNPARSTPAPLLGDSVGVVSDFEKLTGLLLGDGGMSFLDGAGAVVTTAEPMLPVGTTSRTILRYDRARLALHRALPARWNPGPRG